MHLRLAIKTRGILTAVNTAILFLCCLSSEWQTGFISVTNSVAFTGIGNEEGNIQCGESTSTTSINQIYLISALKEANVAVGRLIRSPLSIEQLISVGNFLSFAAKDARYLIN